MLFWELGKMFGESLVNVIIFTKIPKIYSHALNLLNEILISLHPYFVDHKKNSINS